MLFHRPGNIERAREGSSRPTANLHLCVCKTLSLIVLGLSSILSSAQAVPGKMVKQQKLKELTLEQLSQIKVVTPSKARESAISTPAAIFVITNDDIRRSGATSIPEALRLAPGVEVARIDSDKWSIGIRGFGSRLSRSVLVLIDGRTVYTTLLAGTYWEVQDTVLEDVERIEVIRGPGGTIWGPNAVNGVINIITKNSRETHGALVSVGTGNIDQGFVNARYGGTTHGFNYRVYGKGFTRAPEYHLDGRNFDDWRAGQGGFRMDWTRGDRDEFALQGDLYKVRFGESVVATSYTAPYSSILDKNADLTGGNVLWRWTRTLSDENQFQLQAYYDKANRREPNFADLRDTVDFDFIHHLQLDSHQRFSWGAGARFSRGHNVEVVSGLTFNPAIRTDQLLTGFVQDELRLLPDRLSLTVGTKLLHTNFAGFAAEPSARLLWTPSKMVSFWAAYTHAVRTPSDAERDFFLSGYIGTDPNSGLPFFARFNANRDFQPEKMDGYELGYRQLVGKKLFVDVASFYNQYHDLFSQDITGAPFIEDSPAPTHILLPAEFGNGLKGITKGIELSPEWRPVFFARVRGSYSYLHMSIVRGTGSLDVGSAPGVIGSSPQHQLALDTAFDISKAYSLNLIYRFVSSLPAQGVDSYSTGDINFIWSFARHLQFSVSGRNLMQPSHPEFGTDPGPLVGIRRSGYVKLTWTR